MTLLIQAAAIFIWLTVLQPLAGTEVVYSVYLLVAVLALCCASANKKRNIATKQCIPGILLGALFAALVCMANYSLFAPLSVVENLVDLLLCFLGGTAAGSAILTWMGENLPIPANPVPRHRPGRVFLAVFATVAAVDLGYLWLVRYPGILTTDSYATMGQLLGDLPYDNVMPFWHTVTVQPFVKLGLALTGDVNFGIALFHTGQIFFLAAVFGYALMTLYQQGIPLGILGAIFALWAFLPENIAYSVTLWKDIPFAAACLLLVTALYRLLLEVGSHRKWDFLWLLLGALGFSLWRTNGWYAFAAMTAVVAVFLRKRDKLLALFLIAVTLAGAILIGPVLELMGVGDTDFTEAFAVPMQQLSKVIVEERELAPQDEALLSDLFYFDRVKELYDPGTVDPVKFNAFRRDNLDKIEANLTDYAKLYLRLGLQYPFDYFTAWVEETKGYWNAGYDFWTYTEHMEPGPYGISANDSNNLFSRLYSALFRYVQKLEVLDFLTAIGLYAWVVLACFATCIRQKRRELVLAIPVLVLLLGLWLGTPVFCEYRYAYPMMLTAPVILAVTCFRAEKD